MFLKVGSDTGSVTFHPEPVEKVWGLRLNRGSSFRVVLESKLDPGLRATRDEIC